MPIRFSRTGTVAQIYQNPFVGPIDHTVGIQVNLAAMTANEIDANGYLKPALPLTKAGAKIALNGKVFGVTIEEVKVADDNSAATLAALGSQEIAVATIGQINQDVAEDILDRVYTADEIAGFAGTPLVLL